MSELSFAKRSAGGLKIVETTVVIPSVYSGHSAVILTGSVDKSYLVLVSQNGVAPAVETANTICVCRYGQKAYAHDYDNGVVYGRYSVYLGSDGNLCVGAMTGGGETVNVRAIEL